MTRNMYHVLTAIVGILIGLILICFMMQNSDPHAGKLAVAFWSVVPPVWLFGEFYVLKSKLTLDNLDYRKLKDNQQVALRVWAGFALALIVLFFKA